MEVTWCRRRCPSENHGRREARGHVELRRGAYPLPPFARNHKRHHSAAPNFLAEDAILFHARRIGLAQGKTLVLDSIDDLNLAFDLAIHTAPKDRFRAIDPYARAARLAPESDELLVLEAMQRARFSIISIMRRHPMAGLIIKDLFRGGEVWLVDEGLESSLPDGAALATRHFTPRRLRHDGWRPGAA